MGRDVKGGGSRDARTRRSATEGAIVEAAARLFLEDGYVRTSIGRIAAEAGVAVQSIYNLFGSKQAVLSRVLDRAATGPEAPRSVPEFMRERAAEAATPAYVVQVLVDWFLEVQPRIAAVQAVIREAAAVDQGAAELERVRAGQRLRNYGGAAQELEKRGALRPGLSLENAAAVIWSLGHPGVYRFLVMEQDWSHERYGSWLSDALTAALLSSGDDAR